MFGEQFRDFAILDYGLSNCRSTNEIKVSRVSIQTFPGKAVMMIKQRKKKVFNLVYCTIATPTALFSYYFDSTCRRSQNLHKVAVMKAKR